LSVSQKSGTTTNNFTDTIPFLVKSQNGLVINLYKIKIDKEAPSGDLDELAILGWRVYPNPADQMIQMRALHTIAWAELCTADGKVVATFTPQSLQLIIPTEQLPAGLYILRFNTTKNVGTVRLMIAH